MFVVSFVFSGVAWAACIDLPVAQGAASSGVATHMAVAADHDAHHHGNLTQTAAIPDQDPAADHDYSPAVKHCSTIPAVNLTADLSAWSVTFSGALISFRVAQRDLIGFVASLDPGIPIYIL
jgi:hypothetical protein